MPLKTWQTFRFYDPVRDVDSIRFSGYSGRGEFWIAEPAAPAGKSRREQLDRVLDQIEDAIEGGQEPGEVRA